MQTCRKCGIQIRGDKERCPLCEGNLAGEVSRGAFPVIPREKVSRMSVLRMSLFLFILVEAAMIVTCFILHDIPGWAILVMAVAAFGLLDVAMTLYYRNNLLRMVTWEIYFAMIVTLLVDIFTGYPMWSMIWVIPVLFVALMITTVAIGRGTGMTIAEYILYLLFDVIMSVILQILCIAVGWNTYPVPAVISIAITVVFFLGMVIFNHRAFRGETRKFFNV